MSWQDELRRLDEELASGQVSAQDYRQRREALLAQSASGVNPYASSQGQAQQYPGQPQPQAGSSERTQLLGPASPPGGIPAGGGMGPGGGNTALGDGSAEPTQVVRPVGMPQPGGGQPWGHPQPGGAASWGAPATGNTDQPLWTGAELPPLAGAQQTAPWLTQGPETFDTGGGNKGKILAIGGVVILVVLVVVALLVFKPFAGSGPSSAPTSSATTTTTTTPTGPIARVPGTSVPNSVRTFSDVTGLNFLSNDEINAFTGGSPSNTYFSDFSNGSVRGLILIVKESSKQQAVKIAGELGDLEIKYGMHESNTAPTGVREQTVDTATGGPLRRAEYSSGDYVLRIEVQGPSATTADQEMANILTAQLSKLPANG